MKFKEGCVGSILDLCDVYGDDLSWSWSCSLSFGRNDSLLLVGFGFNFIIGLASLNERLSCVGDTNMLDSDVQELIEVLATDLSSEVDAYGSLVDRENLAWGKNRAYRFFHGNIGEAYPCGWTRRQSHQHSLQSCMC